VTNVAAPMSPLELEAYEAWRAGYHLRGYSVHPGRAGDPLTLTQMEDTPMAPSVDRPRVFRWIVNALAVWGIIVTALILIGSAQ
jgi:hypothetical protein